MSRAVRGLTALVTLLALLVGVPMALIRFVGRPWPSPMPSVEVIWQSISAGEISDGTVIKTLAVLVWIAWARLTVSTLIELAARRRGHAAPRVVGLGATQRWAAALLAAISLLAASPRGVAAAAEPSRPIRASLLVADPVRPPMAAPASYEFAVSPDVVNTPPARTARSSLVRQHVVERYESFWSIAEAELGDGTRWHEIVSLNRGVEVAPGEIFDGSAARLVPGWVLLIPDGVAEQTAAPEPIADVVADQVPTTAPEVVTDAAMPAPATDAAPATVVVERGDTLSSIAEEVLGDAHAWPQLFEANHGRDFDGRRFDDPHLILPGWELIVPGAFAPPAVPAVDTPVVAELPAPVPPPTPVVVEAGSPQPTSAATPPAARPLEAPLPDLSNSAASVATDSPGTAPAVASAHDDGAGAVGGPVGPPVPAAPASSAVGPTLPVAPAPRTADHGATDEAGGQAVVEAPRSFPIGLGAGVLLSSGIVAAVAGIRRRKLRASASGLHLTSPSAEAVATESVLRSVSSEQQVVRLDIAVRAAALSLAESGVAVLGAITTEAGAVDLLLTGVAPATAPWRAVSEHRWSLDGAVELDALASDARRCNQPCPALAHLGTTMLDDGIGNVFLDLEAIGLLVVEADDGAAVDVVRAIAAGLAVSPMAEVAHQITVGLGSVALGHPLSVVADSLDAALDAAAQAIGTTASVASRSLPTFALRARHQGGEAWEPALVFASTRDRDADDGIDADLVGMTSVPGRGLGVVVARPVTGATWRLVQSAAHWVLEPLGMIVHPIGLSDPELERVRALLAEADQPLVCAADGDAGDLDVEPVWSFAEWSEPDWPLMVRVLGGTVEVVDAAGEPVGFDRAKALELVVWLSQHRQRATRSAARTALWESDVRDATFANVVSDARRAMAKLVPTVDNQEWIGRTLNDQLPLHDAILTDADVLSARLGRARQTVSPHEAIEVLRPGLEMVRGLPFAGSGYLWPDTEGVTSQMILLVMSAATTLGELYLNVDDVDGVFWATGRGLAVLAGHEELIALRMRAHARRGDLAGVRAEWESYERSLVADVWGGDPAPKLVALRRELLAGPMMTVSP